MVALSTFLEALKRVLEDSIDKNEIVDLMNNVPEGKRYIIIGEALHKSYHYLSDKDIRDKDPLYDEIMRHEIEEYMSQLISIEK